MNASSNLIGRLRRAEWVRRTGRVVRVSGLAIESQGPAARLGELCEVHTSRGVLLAEVIGFSQERLVLMPYADPVGCEIGTLVVGSGENAVAHIGASLLGKVVDGFGRALQGEPPGGDAAECALYPEPINPLERGPVTEVLETGIRAIDALLPIGRGQRIGIFAGSGVGKSTLLGMLSRYVHSDVSVVALVGERGREVKAFADEALRGEKKERTVIVAATSDQPPLVRRRAAFFATAIAEFFRNQGRHVTLLMDSVTRVAMAQREIGLAAGELPTARGYTPSVFALLPRLLERGGVRAAGGSLTGLYTVLVEGDDMNDPIADSVRAILDGHIVLSRDVAHRGRYPSIDILRSVSRLAPALATADESSAIRDAIRFMAAYESARDLIDVGAYRVGHQPVTDRAIELYPLIERFLTQSPDENASRPDACRQLQGLFVPNKSGSGA